MKYNCKRCTYIRTYVSKEMEVGVERGGGREKRRVCERGREREGVGESWRKSREGGKE